MSLARKIGLGTAQWGLAYGIANRHGQATDANVTAMLQLATKSGVSVIDTARSYGAAEDVIGRLAQPGVMRIVTKTLPLRASRITHDHIAEVERAFEISLTKLRRTRIDALLVHNADALLAAEGDILWKLLARWKAAGRAAKIGVSVYHPSQADALLETFAPDIVQLPYNIYDRRFAQAGTLRRLKQANVEIHARSAFLQGLLTLTPEQLPPHFAAMREHHALLQSWLRERGQTPLAAALIFALQNPEIDVVIAGTETPAQLEELLAIAAAPADFCDVPEAFALADERVLNPSLWVL